MFSKILVVIAAMIYSCSSFAILNFLAEEGKHASEVIAYSTALSDLIMDGIRGAIADESLILWCWANFAPLEELSQQGSVV